MRAMLSNYFDQVILNGYSKILLYLLSENPSKRIFLKIRRRMFLCGDFPRSGKSPPAVKANDCHEREQRCQDGLAEGTAAVSKYILLCFPFDHLENTTTAEQLFGGCREAVLMDQQVMVVIR
jgi:hypothetical protein